MKWRALFIPPLLAAALVPGVRAAEAVAVLSSDQEFYQESFRGFTAAFGQAPSFNMQKEVPAVPAGTKVVVTFGAKAAVLDYPSRTTLIACMAPGLKADPSRKGAVVQVWMMPKPADILAGLKTLQPGMKSIAVFWVSGTMNDFVADMRQAAPAHGVEVVEKKLASGGDLPDALRSVLGTADALLLPPDPALVNNQNFTALRDFSWANHVPFYAPTQGLVEKGATASVTSSFDEIGRTAGLLATKILAGEAAGGMVYPEKVQIAINGSSAEKVGLQIPPEALRQADKVLP